MLDKLCIDRQSIALLKKSISIQEKKKIAQKLYTTTNLSLEQIAELVSLETKILSKHLHLIDRPSQAKYTLVIQNSYSEVLLDRINKNFKNLEEINSKLQLDTKEE